MKNEDFNNNLADMISAAFDLLGFNGVNEETVNNFTKDCKDKVCKCKDNIVKKIDEKKEEVKKCFNSTELREFLDNDKYTLQVVATGYDENMVKIHVDPVLGNLKFKSTVDVDAVWFMPNIDITVELPKGIRYDSLKKSVKNGVITVTGIINPVQTTDTFTL